MFSDIDTKSIEARLTSYTAEKNNIVSKYGAKYVPSALEDKIQGCHDELNAAKIHNKCCESLNAWVIWFMAQLHWVEFGTEFQHPCNVVINDGSEKVTVVGLFQFEAATMTLSVYLGSYSKHSSTWWQLVRTATYDKTAGWTVTEIKPDPNIEDRHPIVWHSYEDEAEAAYFLDKVDEALASLSELEGITCETTEISEAIA